MSAPTEIHLTFRGFNGSQMVFEEQATIPASALSGVAEAYGKKHCAAIESDELTMVEIEFMDESDPNERFFRIGTNPDGMVAPARIFPIWTVYKNPVDYPEKFVVRRSTAIPHVIHDPEPLIICDSLEEARAVIPEGAYRMNRMPDDAPHIYEVWL